MLLFDIWASLLTLCISCGILPPVLVNLPSTRSCWTCSLRPAPLARISVSTLSPVNPTSLSPLLLPLLLLLYTGQIQAPQTQALKNLSPHTGTKKKTIDNHCTPCCLLLPPVCLIFTTCCYPLPFLFPPLLLLLHPRLITIPRCLSPANPTPSLSKFFLLVSYFLNIEQK